jgi:hypothetical protein
MSLRCELDSGSERASSLWPHHITRFRDAVDFTGTASTQLALALWRFGVL